jgi:hypothetical protein
MMMALCCGHIWKCEDIVCDIYIKRALVSQGCNFSTRTEMLLNLTLRLRCLVWRVLITLTGAMIGCATGPVLCFACVICRYC